MNASQSSSVCASPTPSSSRKRAWKEEPSEENQHRPLQDEDAKAEDEVEDAPPTTTPQFVELYNVVKNMMEFLPLKDVLIAAQVCQQWSNIAQIVRKQRKNCPYPILYHPYKPHHKEAFEYFNGHNVSKEVKDLLEGGGFAFCDKPRTKRLKKLSSTELSEAARSSLQKDVMSAYDEPQMLIGFGTTTFAGHLLKNRDEDYFKRHDPEIMKSIYGGIQNTIPCLTGISCGMIATIPDSNFIKSLEMEKASMPALACITVPKTTSFTVKTFCCKKVKSHSLRGLKGEAAVQKCREILGISPQDEPNLKGIVLLHKSFHERSSPVVLLIREYLKKNPNVALAGGIHSNVFVNQHPDDSILAGGMLIFGESDDFVRVSTVALEDTKISHADRAKLERLKESMLPDGKSFALMFACNGRGISMHSTLNAESDLFNSLFPSTPLVGSFTYGEFCHEVIAPNATEKIPEKIDFAYTTVFMVVSYKHPSDGVDVN